MTGPGTEQAAAPVRWAKLIGIAAIALHMTLAALGNITDYNTNWAFVQHVLAMDTTFHAPALMWRAVTDPTDRKSVV